MFSSFAARFLIWIRGIHVIPVFVPSHFERTLPAYSLSI